MFYSIAYFQIIKSKIMPDWTWLLLAALFGAASALAVPLALLLYFVRPFEKKPPVEEEFSIPVTLPPVSFICNAN